jgi:MFS family permease
LATALGALIGGILVQAGQSAGLTPLGSYQVVVTGYALIGGVLGLSFTQLSSRIELSQPAFPGSVPEKPKGPFGLHRSKKIVLKLSALFSLDAFAGGFVLQSIVAYWFHVRFQVSPAVLGGIFFGANLLAGLSALSAAWVASKIGLIRTMVFTHIPSNILLLLVPLMPNLPLAIAMLLLRFSISQMDVPTRQSYTMAVVSPEERSAAAGITGIARTTGASLSPVFTGPLLANALLLNAPFFISGILKILYDLLLYRSFRNLRPPEEKGPPNPI